ncbi:hypothetical protein KCV87_13755 [Actinosynnema pretiosum subsp. pretiosum]|uniref:Uncharacterized protein n=2 Tax=Actinosynnema TaxID=40566 RepID=C6W9C7_ACTMD|nr:hypothetical protein [Actinosynnema mirum]ACU35290.1 hypothetical protein Amir_1338 [Actinosynnema mirum DSM 43827]AXX28662.1 hypothetical protein APASM_1297 [Actinosynnema pretiosum subsp. pretiosum]QUF07014.1 hypothetical protein KCV87_13755 [Actinosynnema pretiosum subsp. pretiosum]
MSPRQYLTVVAAAFVLSGLLIMLLPLSTSGPNGLDVSCGNSLGAGFDEIDVSAESAALPEVCARLRAERLAWASPVAVLGAAGLVGALLVRRRT